MPVDRIESSIAEEGVPSGMGLPQSLVAAAVDGKASLLLRQTQQFFEATSDAILFLDRGYRFTFLNRRAQELLASSDELLGDLE